LKKEKRIYKISFFPFIYLMKIYIYFIKIDGAGTDYFMQKNIRMGNIPFWLIIHAKFFLNNKYPWSMPGRFIFQKNKLPYF